MTGELCATPAALDKVGHWFAATPRPWLPAEPADVLVRLHAFGDPVIPHYVARVLARLPLPVCDYIAAKVTFLCAGLAFAGWTGPRPDFGDRPWVIALSQAVDLEDLTAHECAHAWLLPEPSKEIRLMPSFTHWTIHDIDLAEVPSTALAAVLAVRRQAKQDEQQARRLTKTWGFRDV
jgi:hypothetical protein